MAANGLQRELSKSRASPRCKDFQRALALVVPHSREIAAHLMNSSLLPIHTLLGLLDDCPALWESRAGRRQVAILCNESALYELLLVQRRSAQLRETQLSPLRVADFANEDF